jgi:hypothetical protein
LEDIARKQAKDEIYTLHAVAEHFGLVALQLAISTAPQVILNVQIVD